MLKLILYLALAAIVLWFFPGLMIFGVLLFDVVTKTKVGLVFALVAFGPLLFVLGTIGFNRLFPAE